MSGLAAGIRAAYYDQKVCVLERHYTIGGLNSSTVYADGITMLGCTQSPTSHLPVLKEARLLASYANFG